MPYAAMKQAFLLLVACCCSWAVQGVASVFLSERININPVQKLIGGGSYKDPEDKKLMGMINQFRAQICAEMKDENGKDFETYDKCLKFMNEVCRPGSDEKMDGDKKEVTTGKGYCTEFFPEAEKKARAKVAEEDRKAEEEKKKKEGEGGIVDSVADAIGVEGSSDDTDGETGDADEESAAGAASAAAPAGAAAGGKDGAGAGAGGDAASGAKAVGGGAAAAAPAGAAPAGGAPAGAPGGAPGGAPAYPKDEAWYYKDGGKNMKSRMGHMDGGRGLPKQGFVGSLTGPHKDGKSSVSDWQKELGCDADYDECWKRACAKHPDSPWCEAGNKHHSGSLMSSHLAVFVLGAMAVVGLF